MRAFSHRAALVLAALLLTSGSVLGTSGVAAADPAPAAASVDGKAGGTLTVNGVTTKVAYAYAREVPGFFDKTKKDVELILSDVPLDAKALADEFVRSGMAKSGKLHAFEIVIDASGAPISTTWRHDGFKGPTPSGLSSADVFTKKTFDGKVVEGGYKSAAPGDFFDNTYSFDVTFRAPIAH